MKCSTEGGQHSHLTIQHQIPPPMDSKRLISSNFFVKFYRLHMELLFFETFTIDSK